MPFTEMELPSMSKPVTSEDAFIKTLVISVLLGTFVLSKITFISLMTDPFLQMDRERIVL